MSETKPMVTREQYEQARAVLDALPAGYYFKCPGCGDWLTGDSPIIRDAGKSLCRPCHNTAKKVAKKASAPKPGLRSGTSDQFEEVF